MQAVQLSVTDKINVNKQGELWVNYKRSKHDFIILIPAISEGLYTTLTCI
jgi:hypothetical protein